MSSRTMKKKSIHSQHYALDGNEQVPADSHHILTIKITTQTLHLHTDCSFPYKISI